MGNGSRAAVQGLGRVDLKLTSRKTLEREIGLTFFPTINFGG
jgi:hypothetical protein